MGTESAEQPLTPREAALLKQMGEMQALILKLEEKIARLERDSDNSNSPPSSDPPFKTRKGSGKTGRPGARFGHKAHQRAPFPPERVDEKKAHDFPEGQVVDERTGNNCSSSPHPKNILCPYPPP